MPKLNDVLPVSLRGVLVDLAGVLYDGDHAIAGAADAVERLHECGMPVRYVTNTTRSTRAKLVARLQHLGLPIQESDVFTAPLAAKALLLRDDLRPLLLIHPKLQSEFAEIPTDDPNAVVIGDAGDAFSYAKLNDAFRLLINGVPLIAMAANRYFKEPDGLSLDAGPFVRALEFASGVKATVVGKPAKSFFELALADLGCAADQAVMIGDDVHDDVCGAATAGMQGMLVKTGKYRPADESHLIANTSVAENFSAAVDFILRTNS